MASFESVVERVRNNLGDRCQLEKGAEVVVACSGGADSVALAHALAACHDVCRLVAVCFIDHGLRDVSSERLAAQATAETLGVAFRERRVELPTGGNMQASARSARYAALEALAGPDATIATGHTLTDQAETVLQRITRGTGLRGLQGIRYRTGRWIRPLLDVARDETRSLGFPFEDDPSNDTEAYARNRIRLNVLPELRKENPRAEAVIASLAVQAQDELELVDLIADVLDTKVDLSSFPEAWIHTIVRWRFQRGFPDLPPPRSRALQSLVAHLGSGGERRSFSVGLKVRGISDNGRLSFADEVDPRRCVVMHGPGAYVLGRNVIRIVSGAHQDVKCEIETLHQVFLDPTEIHWPLALRPLRHDDRIALKEKSEEQSVAELLRSMGVSWEQKSRKNVLIDGLGRVLWVPPWLESRAVPTRAPRAGDLAVQIATSP